MNIEEEITKNRRLITRLSVGIFFLDGIVFAGLGLMVWTVFYG